MILPMKDLIIIDRDTAERLLAATGFTINSMNSEIIRVTNDTTYPSCWDSGGIRGAIFELKDSIKEIDK